MRSDNIYPVRPQVVALVRRLNKPFIIYQALYRDGKLIDARWHILVRPPMLSAKEALLWAKAEKFTKQLNSTRPQQ